MNHTTEYTMKHTMNRIMNDGHRNSWVFKYKKMNYFEWWNFYVLWGIPDSNKKNIFINKKRLICVQNSTWTCKSH